MTSNMTFMVQLTNKCHVLFRTAKISIDLQFGDARLADGRGDGLDGREQGVQQSGQLARRLLLVSLLHDHITRERHAIRIDRRGHCCCGCGGAPGFSGE